MEGSTRAGAPLPSAPGSLRPAESYAAAALFTAALHLRQHALRLPASADSDAHLLQPAQLQLSDGASGRPAAAAASLSAEAVAPGSRQARFSERPGGGEAARSANEMCSQVYQRLGVAERAWPGLHHIPSIHAGTPVTDVLAIYLKALQDARHAAEPSGATDLAALLRELMHSLVAASFHEGALGQLASQEQAPKGQKQSGAMDLPTLPNTAAKSQLRWHDARASQALRDLAGWLEPHSGPSELELEGLLAGASSAALLGRCTARPGSSPAAKRSSWSATRTLAVGGTAVVGGALMAITGGLAAPIIAGALTTTAGLIGGTAAAGAVSGVATTTTVTATMGVTGAGAGGRAMFRRTGRYVREFAFLPMASYFLPNAVHVEVHLQLRGGSPVQALFDAPVVVTLTVHENTVVPLSKITKGLQKMFRSSKAPRPAGPSPSEVAKGRSRTSSQAAHPISAFQSRTTTVGTAAGAPEAGSDLGDASSTTSEEMSVCSRSSTASALSAGEEKQSWRGWKPPPQLPVPWRGQVQGRIAPECTICVSGWVKSSPSGFVQPWEDILKIRRGWGEPEVYCVVWESRELMQLHTAIMSLVSSYAASQLSKWFITSFISTSLMAAMAIPGTLLLATSVIDNAWSMVLDRADKAGIILAQRLIADVPVTRPVRLIGFSMGARLIFSCVLELARCGAHGVVSEVILLGGPISIVPRKWCAARSVVSGRFVNAFCKNDWLLGIVFRTTRAFVKSAAGLQAVGSIVPEANVEDVDLLDAGLVSGHTDYPLEIGRILEFLRVSQEGSRYE
eukprot:jgi/Tetstr1/436832/TSEL_025610.t1